MLAVCTIEQKRLRKETPYKNNKKSPLSGGRQECAIMGENKTENKGLINISLSEQLPESIENAIKNATDKPSAEVGNGLTELAKAGTRAIRVINALFVNVDKWALVREYNYKETELLLQNKLKYIDENKIVLPDNYVAVPALQYLSYSMDCEELRNLYANLLAKSMNTDTKAYIHPAFVEIIRQLSPLDVQMFNHIALTLSQGDEKHFCIYNICIYENEASDEIIKTYKGAVGFKDYSLMLTECSIINLLRCGLLCEDGNILFSQEPSDYEKISQWPEITPYIGKRIEITYVRGVRLSALGEGFYNICCSDV